MEHSSHSNTIPDEKAPSQELSEEETRQLIDSQLRRAGWEANSASLTFSKGIVP